VPVPGRVLAGFRADKLSGETKPLENCDTVACTVREPLGVCALITAWNSALQFLANKLPPALAAGNTVVIKRSEFTSVSTLALADLGADFGRHRAGSEAAQRLKGTGWPVATVAGRLAAGARFRRRRAGGCASRAADSPRP
jgi:delta 1-pyrroline-5-carboxylate dehydrogenase